MANSTAEQIEEALEAERIYTGVQGRFNTVKDSSFQKLMEKSIKDYNLTITHDPLKGSYLRTASSLAFIKKLPSRSVIHIYTDAPVTASPDDSDYIQEVFTPERSTHVMFLCSNFKLQKTDDNPVITYCFKYLLLTFGDKKITSLINMQFNHRKVILRDIPSGTLTATPLSAISDCKMLTLSEYKPEAVMCTPYELIALLRQNKVSVASKLASMLVLCYPFTRSNLMDFCDFYSFEKFKLMKDLDSMTPPTDQDIDIESALRCAIGILLLGFSFTQIDNKAKQIAKRIAAVTSVILADTFPAEKISLALTEYHLKDASATPYIDKLLQNVICVDNNGNVSSMLGENDLFMLENFVMDDPLNPFEYKMLLQGRMVYKFYHNTSIRWAADFAHSMVDFTSIRVEALTAEIAHIDRIKDTLRACPYLGLQFEIPNLYQIKNCPLLCWAGVKHRARLLTTPEERANFEKYNITSIESHIEQKELMILMASLVNMQPSVNVCAVVATIINDSLDNVEPLIARLSPTDKEDMFKLISRKITNQTATDPSGGEWYQSELMRRRHEDLKITTDEARAYLGRKLNQKVDELMIIADEIPDPQERREAKSKIREYRTKVENAMVLEGEFESAFSAPRHTSNVDFKNVVIKYFDKVRIMIESGNIDAPAPTPFDVRAAVRAHYSSMAGTESTSSTGARGAAVVFPATLIATNPAANMSGAIPTGTPGVPHRDT